MRLVQAGVCKLRHPSLCLPLSLCLSPRTELGTLPSHTVPCYHASLTDSPPSALFPVCVCNPGPGTLAASLAAASSGGSEVVPVLVPLLLAGHVAADAARHCHELLRLVPLQGGEIVVRRPHVHQARFGPDLRDDRGRSTSQRSDKTRQRATCTGRRLKISTRSAASISCSI